MNINLETAKDWEIRITATFGEKAQRVLDYFGNDAKLFYHDGHFVLTDETHDPTEPTPRWSGKSLFELEAYLDKTCDEYDANYKDYPGWESLDDPTQWE